MTAHIEVVETAPTAERTQLVAEFVGDDELAQALPSCATAVGAELSPITEATTDEGDRSIEAVISTGTETAAEPVVAVDPVAAAIAAYETADLRAFVARRDGAPPPPTWYDLDLGARAAALGIEWRELSMLVGSGDFRMFAKPALATDAAVFRLRRWFALSKPDADPSRRIAYQGSDEVRAIVIDVLRRLPVPVRHYAVENVTWREVGRSSRLYIVHSPTKRRALPGDGPHEIEIDGHVSNEDLVALICHELGHGWHRVVCDAEVDWSGDGSDRESLADRIRRGSVTRERWIRDHATNEMLANTMAEIWGMPRRDAPSEETYYRMFAREYDEAAKLADEARQAGALDVAAVGTGER